MMVFNRRSTLALMLIGLLGMAPAWSEVLVLGGTGQLGARIVTLLVDAGEDVTVFVRPTSDRSRLNGLAVDYVVGDLLNDNDVAAVFESGTYRAVIIAVRAPLPKKDFYKIFSRNVATHASEAGVTQIIHHGAIGAGDNMALHPDVPWASVPGLSERMVDHGKAEETFLNSGIGTTIIRNSRVWPDDTPSTGNAELTEDQRTLTPITRADLARFTMDCLDNAAYAGKIFHAQDTSLSRPPPPPRTDAG